MGRSSVPSSAVVHLLLWCCVLLSRTREAAAARKGKCEICKNFVRAFEEGLRSTENSNFAGGDTSWEEEKLGSYANSEVRFVEILDGVCKDFECHTLLEENEEHIERWWFKLRHKKPDLKQWLCHSQLDVCCPENTFGPACKDCPGGRDNPCGGQGTCEGAEEKDGAGTCSCNHGYGGESCQECESGFYDDGSGCLACHRACKEGCGGGGAADCDECASGYVRIEEGGGCRDVNECEEREREMEGGEEEEEPLCEEGKYCFNTQGSYRCNDCDRSCERSCVGPGPAKCVKCASGYYTARFNVCRDINECEGGEGWEGDPVKCEGATFCDNTPGGYQCKACHVACLGGCKGAGPTNCVECKDGFKMDDGECKDINECDEESPCELESETCSNLIGSFKCKCRTGLMRVEGKCVENIAREKETKTKKKKKKRVKKQTAEGVEGAEKERVREPVTAEQGEEREGGGREGKGREGGGREGGGREGGGREGEGESETREEREKMATGTTGEGGEGSGSHDQPQESHDKLPGDAMHDQNLSHGSRDPLDKSRDVPPDLVQSVDLQDNTRDEL